MLFSTKPLPYNVRRVFPARTPLLKISGTAFLSIFRKRSTLGPAATVVQLLLNLPRLMSSSAAASASASQSSAQTPVKVRSGSCLCRSVTYEVTGEPFTMRVCHCGNCQKATGAAFMTNAFFRDNQIRVVEGERKLKVFADANTTSGTPLNRYFCGECGSNLFLKSQIEEVNGKKNDVRIVASGTLDEEVDWVPQTELFKEQRRHFVTGIEVQKKGPKL